MLYVLIKLLQNHAFIICLLMTTAYTSEVNTNTVVLIIDFCFLLYRFQYPAIFVVYTSVCPIVLGKYFPYLCSYRCIYN